MSIWHLIILLVVVVLLFGTSKLRNIGSDLGGAVRDFKKGLDGGEDGKPHVEERLKADPPPANAEAQREHDASQTK